MKKILSLIVCLMVGTSVMADSGLWVKINSSTVNEVFFSFAKGNDKDQKVDKEWVNTPAGYFVLTSNVITEKTGNEMQIAVDWYKGYKKSDPATGKWLELTPAEKAAVDASNNTAEATKLAQEAVTAALRELVNETFGNGVKEITEQQLIDRIDSKL